MMAMPSRAMVAGTGGRSVSVALRLREAMPMSASPLRASLTPREEQGAEKTAICAQAFIAHAQT